MNPPGGGADPIEIARWQGGIDAQMQAGDRRFQSLEHQIEAMDKKLDQANEELAVIKVKVALYGAIGGAIGSAIVAIVVAISTKAIGG